MANEENLAPNLSERSKEEARKIQVAGGKARQEQRRRRKTLREELLALLEEGDTQKRVSLALLQKALEGDTAAWKALESSIGEKQADKTELTGKDGAALTPINIIMPKEKE